MHDHITQRRQYATVVPLSPLSLIRQASENHPDGIALVHGDDRRNWAEVYVRCFAFAGALAARKIGRGHTVAILAPNLPEMFEAHFAVPMSGATLCALNPRLEASVLAEILVRSQASALIVDPTYAPVLAQMQAAQDLANLLVVEIASDGAQAPCGFGDVTYEGFLSEASPDFIWSLPEQEQDPLTLSWGETIKGLCGVVHDQRAGFLNAQSLLRLMGLPRHAVVYGALPLSRANGWGLPWAVAAVAGTFVCTAKPRAAEVMRAISAEEITHVVAGSDFLYALVAEPDASATFGAHAVQILSSGPQVSDATADRLEQMGVRLTEVMGLPETQSPVLVFGSSCGVGQAATGAERRMATAAPGVEILKIADPVTHRPVPADGVTPGRILLQSGGVMAEYFEDPYGTAAVFPGGWLETDLMAVRHPDGCIALLEGAGDRLETRGEVIDAAEIAATLELLKEVRAAVITLRHDPVSGPVPCAFVELRSGRHLSRAKVISHCSERMARFKVPRTVIFGALPRDENGWVDREAVRQRGQAL